MANEELRRRVRAVIAEALRIKPVALPPFATIDTVPRWDSLGHLDIIETISRDFNVNISHGEAGTLLDEDAMVSALVRRNVR